MRFISSTDLKKIINEAVANLMKEDSTPGAGGLGGGLLGGGLGNPNKGGGSKLGGGLGNPKLGGGLGNPKLGGGLGNPGGKFSGTSNLVGNQANGKQFNTEGGELKDGSHLPKVLNARFEKWHEEENPNRDNATNDDEILKVDIGYIFPQHSEYLKSEWEQKYSDIFTPQWFGYGKNYMEFRVKPDKEQDFINIVPDIFDDIAKLSGVNPKFYKKKGWTMVPSGKNGIYHTELFKDKVAETIDYITKAPSKYEMEKRDFNVASTWKELLSNLEDRETLNKMQGIAGMVYSTQSASLSGGNPYDKKGRRVGHVLSVENKIEVFAQDPNAEVVTQEWVWRDMYNRKIVDKSKTIIITKPTSRKPRDPQAFDKACIRCNYGGANDFYDQQKRGELSLPQIWAVRAEYNKLNPADTFFGSIIVYDVKNTELMTDENGNPLPDKFNTEVNLSNNLLGIPNAATDVADQQLAQSLGKQFVKGEMQELTDDEVKEIGATIRAIASRDANTAIDTGNIGDDIVSNCYALAKLKARNINFSKPEFEEAYCQAFSCSVAATYGFQSPKGAQYLRQCLANRGNTDKELSTMIQMFFAYYKKFIAEVNYDLAKKAKAMKQGGSKLSTPVSNIRPMKKAVEEDGANAEQGVDIKPVPPLSPEQLSNVLGIPAEMLTGEYGAQEEVQDEVQDDTQTNQQIQESFFNMLDRIELI